MKRKYYLTQYFLCLIVKTICWAAATVMCCKAIKPPSSFGGSFREIERKILFCRQFCGDRVLNFYQLIRPYCYAILKYTAMHLEIFFTACDGWMTWLQNQRMVDMLFVAKLFHDLVPHLLTEDQVVCWENKPKWSCLEIRENPTIIKQEQCYSPYFLDMNF